MKEWQGVAAIARRVLDDAHGEAVEITKSLQSQLSHYATLPADAILPGVTTSVVFGVTALVERRPPSSAELEELDEVAEIRARQGVPLDLLLNAYSVGARHIWAKVHSEGAALDVDPGALLEAATSIWRWADMVTAHAAGAHRRMELELARHHQQHRTNFLRSLVNGSLDASQLSAGASAHGLDPIGRYRAFRAQAPASTPTYLVERALTDGGASAVGIVDGEFWGLAERELRITATNVTVGIGPPTALPAAATSFATATRVLRSAQRFALSGVFTLQDLGLRIPIATEEAIGDMLTARYLKPLRGLRQGGAGIKEGVRAYLACGQRVEQAARKLFIHPNTLRYRLARFEEVTGADLGDTPTIVEVWWALERSEVQRSPAPSP